MPRDLTYFLAAVLHQLIGGHRYHVGDTLVLGWSHRYHVGDTLVLGWSDMHIAANTHSTSTILQWGCQSRTLQHNRDGNSGTGTRPDGAGYGDDFLPAGGTRTRPEPRRVRDGYFFSPAGNPTGTRCFITAMILGCEQLKMCSFFYINYDLF
jgi:hypothetical protein